MDDLIRRASIVERLGHVIQNDVPSSDGKHPVTAETVLNILKNFRL